MFAPPPLSGGGGKLPPGSPLFRCHCERLLTMQSFPNALVGFQKFWDDTFSMLCFYDRFTSVWAHCRSKSFFNNGNRLSRPSGVLFNKNQTVVFGKCGWTKMSFIKTAVLQYCQSSMCCCSGLSYCGEMDVKYKFARTTVFFTTRCRR